MKYHKTEGIILNTKSLNEKDKTAIFLTQNLGKIYITIPSAKNIKCRFTFITEKLNNLKVDLYKTKNGYLLTEFRLIKSFKNIKKSLPLILSSEIAIEITDKLIPIEDKSTNIYFILKNFLETVDKYKTANTLLEAFKIKLLHSQGMLEEFGMTKQSLISTLLHNPFQKITTYKFEKSEIEKLKLFLDKKIFNYFGAELNYQKLIYRENPIYTL